MQMVIYLQTNGKNYFYHLVLILFAAHLAQHTQKSPVVSRAGGDMANGLGRLSYVIYFVLPKAYTFNLHTTMNFTFELDKKGYVKRRETFDLEYKENFQLGDNLLKYLKTLAGMANNKGGQILFGIKDSPHMPIGMKNVKFKEVDPAIIDRTIREYFSSELEWEMNILDHKGVEFGQLLVKEAKQKPIICKKNKDNVLREAAIYYRYRAITKEIEFAELSTILNQEKEKETRLWLEHIQKISIIGPQNVHLLDIVKSEINVGKGNILIDKNIVDKIKFIKEGQFSEVEGAPTLRLIGDIAGVTDSEMSIPNDILYPYFRSSLQEKFGVNQYQVSALIWKLKLKGDKRYHSEIKSGQNSGLIQKYSEAVVVLIEQLLSEEGAFDDCLKEYKELKKQEKRKSEVKVL